VPHVGVDSKEYLVSGMAFGGALTAAWKCQILSSCDRCCVCEGHVAKAQEGLVVSGVEGGWYVRTPDNELM